MSKSIQAVISPHKFTPALFESTSDFEELWQKNKPWLFSNLAHIAYFNEIDVKAFMKILGATDTYFYDKKGAQAFLSIWENKAVLSFRGTQPIEDKGKHHHKLGFLKKFRIKHFLPFPLPIDPLALIFLNNDILADLKFIPTSFDSMEKVNVHSGFLGEIDKLWADIVRDINQHVKGIPIWVTGHSLGGAMATLAGMRHPFEAVTTFGEPRVGFHINKAFEAKSHSRYVNGDDPVTKLPPELPFGYDHHGDVKRISDEDGETSFIYDHSIIYYSENLY